MGKGKRGYGKLLGDAGEGRWIDGSDGKGSKKNTQQGWERIGKRRVKWEERW